MTKADLINELNKLATQVSDSLENAKVLVNELKAMETALENLPDDADDIEDDVKDDE